MAIIALYRKSSGQVIRISMTGHLFPDVDPARFGILVDPHCPDGTDWRAPMKIALPHARTVRNATQAEQDRFQQAMDADVHQQDQVLAQRLLRENPQWSKVFGCLVESLMDEINTLRAALDLPPKSARSLLWHTESRIGRCTYGHPGTTRMDSGA